MQGSTPQRLALPTPNRSFFSLTSSHAPLLPAPLPACPQGVAINFVTNDDERLLQDIQRFYNTVIEVRRAGEAGRQPLVRAALGWAGLW